MVWLISESEVNGMTTTIDRLIRLQEVQSLTGYKRTSIYRLMGQGEFPNAVNLVRELSGGVSLRLWGG